LDPFKKIPNCGTFKIKLGRLDKIFAFFGLKVKLNTKIKITPFDEDSKYGRYADTQIIRLNKLVGKPEF
jgi:hypothetical protein